MIDQPPRSKLPRLLLAGATLAGGLLIALVALWLTVISPPIPPSAIGGPFELADQDGKRVTEADLVGRPTLMFFGFTHCPDICPTTMLEVSEVLKELGAEAARVQVMFVTVDPERDTPVLLKDYLSLFAPGIRALSGDRAHTEAIIRAYRVYARKVPTSGGDYTMDHTAGVYLIDAKGRFIKMFDLKRPAAEAATDLRRWL